MTFHKNSSNDSRWCVSVSGLQYLSKDLICIPYVGNLIVSAEFIYKINSLNIAIDLKIGFSSNIIRFCGFLRFHFVRYVAVWD